MESPISMSQWRPMSHEMSSEASTELLAADSTASSETVILIVFPCGSRLGGVARHLVPAATIQLR